ncbi:uncharacterized protein N7446_011047 [Penicillium canescens]|uniref:Uncharacterized protein n=1 Tax=Penicillium canescens TaxID=5083 RepID=A0AAD6NBG4_PENCN|nr:uncharacterized protein N7446_011047 [Penicillium canescens]KAJ6029600.1 hypothetical protein N7444_012587 [Penicillium canescens]KAJ6048032.1 hypothetical protein N7460_004179 [Penicillium canescens]KAJ6048364.1 hypothetical protein N7446_011047 [Penicillium canescens]
MTKAVYERWLKDAEKWTPADDWDPTEYYQWCERLAQARNNLKGTMKSIDEDLLQEVASVCEKHRGTDAKHRDVSDISKVIVRYSIAYNFFVRRTFEDIEEKQAVARTQKHMALLGIGMNDIDLAQMLQKAADKVPFKDATKGALVEFSKQYSAAADVAMRWRTEINTYEKITTALIRKLVEANVKVADVPGIVAKLQVEEEKLMKGENAEKMCKFFTSDEEVRLFVSLRADPAIPNSETFLARDAHILNSVVKSKELDSLLNKALALEEASLTWAKTIGPAVTAIRRLGRRSAGKDASALAQYAKDHIKPSH